MRKFWVRARVTLALVLARRHTHTQTHLPTLARCDLAKAGARGKIFPEAVASIDDRLGEREIQAFSSLLEVG